MNFKTVMTMIMALLAGVVMTGLTAFPGVLFYTANLSSDESLNVHLLADSIRVGFAFYLVVLNWITWRIIRFHLAVVPFVVVPAGIYFFWATLGGDWALLFLVLVAALANYQAIIAHRRARF